MYPEGYWAGGSVAGVPDARAPELMPLVAKGAPAVLPRCFHAQRAGWATVTGQLVCPPRLAQVSGVRPPRQSCVTRCASLPGRPRVHPRSDVVDVEPLLDLHLCRPVHDVGGRLANVPERGSPPQDDIDKRIRCTRRLGWPPRDLRSVAANESLSCPGPVAVLSRSGRHRPGLGSRRGVRGGGHENVLTDPHPSD
jgi:hypothetical protein